MNEPRAASQIEKFFASFEDASAHEDWARYGDMFLTTFLNIDPSSASPMARDDLIAFLPRRKTFFESAGAIGTRLARLDVQALDATHAQWRPSEWCAVRPVVGRGVDA